MLHAVDTKAVYARMQWTRQDFDDGATLTPPSKTKTGGPDQFLSGKYLNLYFAIHVCFLAHFEGEIKSTVV